MIKYGMVYKPYKNYKPINNQANLTWNFPVKLIIFKNRLTVTFSKFCKVLFK